MASHVYVKNPNGTTYVYENISYWDKEEKRTRHRRKCIGKVDPHTKQIIPTGRKTAIKLDDTLQKSEHCRVLTIGPALLLDKAAEQTKLARVLRLIFPEDYAQILMCAYYLAKWKGHRCYQHIYFDSLKAELENRKFTHRLKECYDALCSGSEKAEDAPFIRKYFMVTTYPKRQRKIEYNEDAIQEHKENNTGWFVLISNDIRDATEALLAYRRKDVVEKNFDGLKNDLDMKRLRIHTNATMEGRIFIQFVALILTTYLK